MVLPLPGSITHQYLYAHSIEFCDFASLSFLALYLLVQYSEYLLLYSWLVLCMAVLSCACIREA